MRDFAQVEDLEAIHKPIVDKACAALEVDDLGLDRIDRQILRVLITRYRGGPVGLETLAASTGEDSTTIEDVVEPYLLQIGMLQRTPRGRMASPMAYQHLGFPPPKSEAGTLDFDGAS